MASKNKCKTPDCKNMARPHGAYCEKCKYRKIRENNPYYYHFNILRANAKRRGKIFTLTLKQYTHFCTETNYLDLKGRAAEDMTIDCKDPKLGYTYENIRILSKSENCSKGDRYTFIEGDDTEEEVPF